MGTMIFQIPPSLAGDAVEALQLACIAGGQDHMPFPTQTAIENGHLLVTKQVDESGQIVAPWDIPGFGRLMLRSATLMERLAPYQLGVELARGKINQVRSQAADWMFGGLVMPPGLTEAVHKSTAGFGHSLGQEPAESDGVQKSLGHACDAAQQLVEAYARQVFQIRHARHAKLDSLMSVRLNALPRTEAQQNALLQACNAVSVHVPWSQLEPVEGQRDWALMDSLVSWAYNQGLAIHAGPLVDFSGYGLPDWLWPKANDLGSMCGYLSEHVRHVVERYHQYVRSWQVTSGSNLAGVLASGEDELIWLTVRLCETVRHVNPQLEITVGLSQPWGEYLGHQERSQTPFSFADTMFRSGLKVTALDLEIIAGVAPRGSYCRDGLELSKLIDLYSYLTTPLQLTLGYPSSAERDPLSDNDLRVGFGHWRDGFREESQADWTRRMAELALCKPLVRHLQWAHFSDAAPHQFPHAGLLDAAGQVKPAFRHLAQLRADHLK